MDRAQRERQLQASAADTTGRSYGAGARAAYGHPIGPVNGVLSLGAASTTCDCPSGNDGTTNTFVVYPDSATIRINGLSAGSGINLANNTACEFVKVSATRWVANLSA